MLDLWSEMLVNERPQGCSGMENLQGLSYGWSGLPMAHG